MPLTFPPAQKALPAPVSRSTPTSGFSPQLRIMPRSAGVSASDMALRTSGRFSVMMATRSRITQRSSFVPVSILASALAASLMTFPPIQFSPSFRDGAKHQTRNLEIPGSHFVRPGMTSQLKLLHPGPQFHLRGPGAARLLQHVPIAHRDRVGIEKRVRPLGRIEPRGAADAAIDDKMRDMDALRRQFARHA